MSVEGLTLEDQIQQIQDIKTAQKNEAVKIQQANAKFRDALINANVLDYATRKFGEVPLKTGPKLNAVLQCECDNYKTVSRNYSRWNSRKLLEVEQSELLESRRSSCQPLGCPVPPTYNRIASRPLVCRALSRKHV